MKFGIIGYGRMGTLYYKVLTEMGIEISFICDLVSKDSDILFFQNYKQALETCNVDGVIVSTYGPDHYHIIKNVIARGIKYIVCEKPFTTSVKHADKLISKLKKSKIRLSVNYARRVSNTYKDLKKIILDEKIIGEIGTIVITSGAGGLSALGTHYFDLVSFIFNEKIQSVFSISINKELPNPRGKIFKDPGGCVLIKFENNKRAFIDMGDDLGIQPIIEIIGEYGRIRINEINKEIEIKSRIIEDRKKPKNLYGLPNPILKTEIFDIGGLDELTKMNIENLISDLPIINNAEMAKKDVEIYSAIRKSFETNEVVRLPLTGDFYEKEFMVT